MTLMDGVFWWEPGPCYTPGWWQSSQPVADTSARCAPPGRGCRLCIPGPRRRHSPGLPPRRRGAAPADYASLPDPTPRGAAAVVQPSRCGESALVRRSSSTPTSPAVGPSRVRPCHRPEHGFASPYQVPPGCDGVRGCAGANIVQCGLSGALFLDGRVIAGAASAVAGGNASRVEQRLGCRAHLSQHRASYPYWQGVPAGAPFTPNTSPRRSTVISPRSLSRTPWRPTSVLS